MLIQIIGRLTWQAGGPGLRVHPDSEGKLSAGATTQSCAPSFGLAMFANGAIVIPKPLFIERANAMPTRNVNLTDELDRFVATKVKSGRYENASEVVRAGLRTLEREELQYEAKLAAIRAAIDDGDASGIADSNVFGRVRKALKLTASR